MLEKEHSFDLPQGILEQEFKEKSWELFDFNPPSDIFKSNPSKMWKKCLETIGGDYLIWSNSPNNPQMN